MKKKFYKYNNLIFLLKNYLNNLKKYIMIVGDINLLVNKWILIKELKLLLIIKLFIMEK